MYSINEVEKMYGLKASTLRFYEKEGILPKINRDSGGRRKYTEQELDWIQLVLALRSTGMTIGELKEYMDLIRKGHETLEERREMLLKYKANVETRMAETFTH
ncbi:MerR family transcriptional regulator [Priestia megaterium]|uniref:MerR family transcriptional regulator n=1 Tax=Priestia megaterium TaxID=1404 RepID=UPI00203ECD6F|nr:MerR family transcriptional regulator [Priestia megaterium]MCM3186977.1 MerR family transcriptional regulator [Priestia megaterium]